MDYEKAYKETIDKLRKLHNDWNSTQNRAAKEIELVLPELRESEDERIKKEIIDFIQEREIVCSNGDSFLPYKKWIAWLEKQGKNSSWSEEDREMLDNCLGLIQEIDSTQEEQNWLKSLKPHWKPSEEQIQALEYAMAYISKKEDFSVHETIELLYNDLKNL